MAFDVTEYVERLKTAACSCWYCAYLSGNEAEWDIHLSYLKLMLDGLALHCWKPVFNGCYLAFRKEV